VKTIFDLCKLRADILKGDVGETDFAADLTQVICNFGPDEYRNANPFFSNTYPTRRLMSLLSNVCSRLSGAGADVPVDFQT
jgi:predicted AAA+ superfamily ATPase